MKNFLTVHEFSILSDICPSTLRFWDKEGIFSPAFRGADKRYRYYSPEQIVTVKFINMLSDLKVPLKTIRELVGDRDPQKIRELIMQREKFLNAEFQRLQECFSVMQTRLELIDNGLKAEEKKLIDKISIIRKEESFYVPGPKNKWESDDGLFKPFMNFCEQAKAKRINLSFPVGGMYESWDSFSKAPEKPNCFYSLDPNGTHSCEAGDYLVGFSRGNYSRFKYLLKRMGDYIKENNISVTGPVFTVYLYDEISNDDASEYLSQVYIAVSK